MFARRLVRVAAGARTAASRSAAAPTAAAPPHAAAGSLPAISMGNAFFSAAVTPPPPAPPDPAALPLPAYTSLATATADDFTLQDAAFADVSASQADRVLALLRHETSGTFLHTLDLLEHSLQSATRAHRDGADEELVVVALLHDIGEVLCPGNHGEVAAGLLRPYISAENHWLLLHHEVYQAHYYAEAMNERPGMNPIDPDLRDRFKDHPCHAHTVHFCENYDQTSFDPEYDSLPLEFFEPMVRRVFAREPWKHTGGAQQEPAIAKAELASAYPPGAEN